jgi:type IV secretion system protein VirD4
MSDEFYVNGSVVARVLWLACLLSAATMIGGFVLGQLLFALYPLYLGSNDEPYTTLGVVVGTIAGILVVWNEFATNLEGIAKEYRIKLLVPRLRKSRSILGTALAGGCVSLVLVVIGGLIFAYNTGQRPPADSLVLLALCGAAAGLVVGFGEQYGLASKIGEEPSTSYVRLGILYGVGGFATFGLFIGIVSMLKHASVTPTRPGALGLALGWGLAIGYGAICRHAYKRRESLILQIPYATIPGTMIGGFAGLALVLMVRAKGYTLPFATVLVFMSAGALIGIWYCFGRNRNVSLRERFFRFVDFLTTSRPRVLGVGLLSAATGLLVLWFAAPPLLSALAERDSGLGHLILPGAGTMVGLYLFIAQGLLPIWIAVRGPRLRTDTHGQAGWATIREVRRAGLMPRKQGAIYLGQFLADGEGMDAIGYQTPVHLITVGRTGSGKGTGLIIPNLSTLRRSVLIIDPKGEAAAITARKRANFGRVVMLNPFNLYAEDRPWMQSDGFNPLSTIRMDKNFLDDCAVIGQSLVKQDKSRDGHFFSTSAQDLLTALVMHEKIERRDGATLGHVRTMLTKPWGVNEQSEPTGIARTIFDMTQSDYEPLRSKAGRFKTTANSNRDVIFTAINETSFIDSIPVADDLASTNDFRFADMKSEIVTVYLILPALNLEEQSNWLRLIIASALRELLLAPGNSKMPPVLFMLDEFAQLGHLPGISTAMNITRSYGVQLWPFVQDLTQLKGTYGDSWENFLGASAALTAFAPGDLFTANYLSRQYGNKTVIVESENVRGDPNVMGGGFTPQSQPLIRPEELIAMPPGQMLCFVHPAKKPFFTQAHGYWKTVFGDGLDANPYHPS